MKSLALGLLLVSLGTSATSASAHILDLAPSGTTLGGAPVATSGRTSVGGRTHSLPVMAKGLYKKRIFFASVTVYLTQVLTRGSVTIEGQSAPNALEALAEEDIWAATLHFVRDVDAATINSTFREILQANANQSTQATVDSMLAVIGQLGDVVSGQSLHIVGERLPGGTEVVSIQNTTNGRAHSTRFPAGDRSLRLALSLMFGAGPDGDADFQRMQDDILTRDP